LPWGIGIESKRSQIVTGLVLHGWQRVDIGGLDVDDFD